MTRRHADFEVFLKKSLKDPKLKAEFDKLQPEFAAIEAMLRARVEKGLRQQDLARRMKTKQSVISRVEAGKTSPTVSFLQRLAQALDSRLEIRFIPQ